MPCHSHREGRLGVLERGHAGQDLTLEELERGAAAGGDVRHLLREASLLDSRDGVAAADDGDAAVLAGDLSEGVGNVEGALGESLELEDAHGAVPDDGLALLELGLITILSAMGMQEEINKVKENVPTIHEGEDDVSSEGYLAETAETVGGAIEA